MSQPNHLNPHPQPNRRMTVNTCGRFGAALSLCASLVFTGCTPPSSDASEGERHTPLRVVATTDWIADLAQRVGGPEVAVTSLIPSGADPHTYEPGLRTLREVAHADAIFSNGLLLEDTALTRTLHAVSAPGTPIVALAEQLPQHGGTLLPLVEDASLDSVWLGFRVDGRDEDSVPSPPAMNPVAGERLAVPQDTTVRLVHADTPPGGRVVAFRTDTFGTPVVLVDSADPERTATLPVGAHTHVSWSFSSPGYYSLEFEAESPAHPHPARGVVQVAVGVDPYSHPAVPVVRHVLERGHADITADWAGGTVVVLGDAPGGITAQATQADAVKAEAVPAPDDPAQRPRYVATDSVVYVPPTTVFPIPPLPEFRFLGPRGAEVYLLRQAVVGTHVHGDVDPHAWLSAANGVAYVSQIEESLSGLDPARRVEFQRNAQMLRGEILAADALLRQAIAAIPPAHRNLVSTHDGFGYLAGEYGLRRAGVVAPHSAAEATPRDIAALGAALRDLGVPAVFVGPQSSSHQEVLRRVAAAHGVRVCVLYGDVLDPAQGVRGYVDLLQVDARTLLECLGGTPGAAAGRAGDHSADRVGDSTTAGGVSELLEQVDRKDGAR